MPRELARVVCLWLAMLGPLTSAAPVDDGSDEPGQEERLRTLNWRCIGPARGGRGAVVAGVTSEPDTFYLGATGGGVWRTTNAGRTWENISDRHFKTGSVGAIAVAPSDRNVIYVGMGESCIRGNFSHGDGVYRSRDAGKTWQHVGLGDTRQIGCIDVHPNDPNVVLVAALGHVFGPNAERGVFRSTDGGENWKKVLFVSDKAGAVDLCIDPFNPRVIFAATWQVHRAPWTLSSGGEGSGLHRSTDGGETWQLLTNGLPGGIKGKIGVSASAARRDLVYAIVEADDGGVFRSTDGGDSWQRVNEDRALRQRAWYYTHIHADPHDADTVYVLNVQFHKSIDGGRTYTTLNTPHADHHGLWLNPEDPKRMVMCNDGGAAVSLDGGQTWSTQQNQPTAQFYHVAVDNQFPYRVYGAQQDNSTASVSSRAGPDSWQFDFYDVGGGESGYVAVRPDDPNVIYAGSYGGYLTRYDRGRRSTRNIQAWPENPIGAGADVQPYRFQWTFPIVLSPHDPSILYVGANVLFMSNDDGHTWTAISPDLTTNDKAKQAPSGGPITKDNTSVEYYCTIFTVAESPVRRNMIWAGTDDGLVHVTLDGGQAWRNVTPAGMGDWPLISMVEPSPHDADTAYLAVNRYKMDDFAPYVYRTRDAGATWEQIAHGIPDGAFVRSVREDPVRRGLLYAATETGVWYSPDDGGSWHSLQRNLPAVPVTDLVVKDEDLVISTQGRSFWIMDDVSPLRQLTPDVAKEPIRLLEPRPAYRTWWAQPRIQYWLRSRLAEGQKLELALLDPGGREIRRFGTQPDPDSDKPRGPEERPRVEGGLPADPGVNLFAWNLRLSDLVHVPGVVGWPGTPPGALVPPGLYTARLAMIEGDGGGGSTHVMEQRLELRGDPRVATPTADYQAQFDLLVRVDESVSAANRAVKRIRRMRGQIDAAIERADGLEGHGAIRDAGQALKERLTAIEEALVQTRAQASQDMLNFPVRLVDKLAALHWVIEGDYRPTEAARAVFEKLAEELRGQLETLDAITRVDVAAFNGLVSEQAVPAVRSDD